MGKVIRKKIRGMGWTAKVSLVLLCTLLTSVFMYEGWYKPLASFADVAIQQSWTSVYTGTAFPTSIDLSGATAFNKTPAIAAGPKRLLVVGVSTEVSSATAAQTCTAKYGGQNLTLATGNNATSAQQHTYLFYLPESGIAAATDNTLTIAVAGGTSVNNHVYAAVYNGVDQSNLGNIASFLSTSQSSTVGPISPSLVIANGDVAVEMVSVASTSSTTRTISTWASGWSAAVGPNSTTTSPRISVYAATDSTAGTTTSQHTASSSAMRAMSGMVIKAASGVPVISSVAPNVGVGAGSTTVTITGTGMTGATAVNVSGTLVTAGAPTVIDDNTLTVPITADAAATPGARNITVVNGNGTSAPFTATGFVVSNNPAPTVTSVSPSVLGQGGAAQSVTISGANFVSGTGLASNFGTGVTVNSTTFVDANTLTANITVTTSATAGAHNVIVTNPDTQTGTGTGLLTVNTRATVTSVAPATGAQGATNQIVTINGSNFVPGGTLAAAFSGTGITTNSTTYVSPTQLTADITISAAAATGARTVTVTNGDTGVSSAAGSFTVYNPTAINISSVSPTTIGQGANGVLFHIYGANFVSGATVTFSSSRFVVASTGTQTGPTSFVDAGHLTVLVNTTTSSVQSSNVTVTNPDLTNFALTAAVATIARPTVTSITPSSVLQGTGTDVTITGTGFQTGATVAFPDTSTGITISNLVVASATSITAHIDTTEAATLGIQTVTVANPDFGSNTTTFNVFSATAPTLASMTPATIGQGATALNVDVFGTNFDPAVTAASLNFGSGVTTNSVTFVDSAHLQANITLSTSATAGAHVVTVTNPNNEAGTASILTVTARPGTTTITPTTGILGTTFDIAITSSALATGPGFGVTISGTGITVNSVTLNSATSVTANVTIDPDYLVAPLGARTLTLSNGDYGVRTATLTIRGAAPTVTAASTALRQGAVAQDVLVTGTNFYPGAVTTFSNTGVSVNSTTYVDSATLRVNVNVSGTATLGNSNITVTNSDTQAATGTGIFTVTAAPTVVSNTPVKGGQGATMDVVVTGTNFGAGAVASFSDTGITVNSTTFADQSHVTANITIAIDALLTARSITITNADGSNGAGGSFTIAAPFSTTVGSLSFTRVTPTSITVQAGFSNDSNGDNSCTITWGTAPGSYPNTATVTKVAGAYSATISGLTGGDDGEGKAYYFRAAFTDADGFVGNNVLTGVQSSKASDLIHNSQNLSSSKWAQGWGVAGGKYGTFNCSTCHVRDGSNSKLIASSIQSPSLENWSSSTGATLNVVFRKEMGSDTAHVSSTAVCEACHSRTNHHLNNNPGPNHMGTQACTDCHSHNEGFMPTCTVCHASAQGERRQIVGNGGDFFGNLSTHGSPTVGSLSCIACHDTAQHRNIAGGVNVLLKNADGGPSALYDGTSATASAVKDACISCHDANGASRMGTNSQTPFAGSNDFKSPANISQYWPATGGAHDTNMVCFNCHGNSNGVDGSTSNPKYNGHASGAAHMVQDKAFDVANPNNYCFNCHNATSTDPNKSSKDIASQMALAYKHTTAKCFDCHGDENNATDSLHSLRAGSQVSGSGVIANNIANASGKSMTWSTTSWGGATASADLASNTVSAEYQVCFKCHAAVGTGTTPAVPGAGTAAASLTNLALEFNPNNASRHPVGTPLAAANQLTAARLAGGWAPGSVMTCSDCHATDSAASKGPHGSSVKWMLAGTNKAWPYTTAAGNGGSTGTFVTLATYNANDGTTNGLFCLNCHTVRPASGVNGWHSNSNLTTSRHSGSQTIAGCADCHIRVPHGGKISRLLQTTNAPNRYRSNGNGTTPSFTHWGSNTTNVKGSSMSGSLFGSSCSEHSGSGGEVW